MKRMQKRIEIVERFLPATVLQSFSPLKSSTFLGNYFGVMNIKTRPIAILFYECRECQKKSEMINDTSTIQLRVLSFRHTHEHPARRTTQTHTHTLK